MNTLSIFTLKALRKLYAKAFGGYQLPPLQREEDPDKASDMIYNLLMQDKPCMIARFGAFELATIVNYLGITNPHHSIWKYIKGEQEQWWWNKKLMNYMQNNAGFFPPTEDMLSRFCEMMLEDAKEVDLLGSWIANEHYLQKRMPNVQKVKLVLLEPYHSQKPWSRALTGKKVLVIHPFTQLIEQQYRSRRNLFKKADVLPDFELQTITAIQSLGGKNNGFKDWFKALQWMKNEIDKRNYDICMIGCGAYGFPLAAHVKRQGGKAVHLGGALQLLFGIKGKRWEVDNYASSWGLPQNAYTSLFNEYWIRPTGIFKPQAANKVEGGCYW